MVGHAVRNIRECVRMADNDLKEKTAILDSRFLAGDSALWADLDKVLVTDVLNRNQSKFFKAKLEESRKRHAAYGDSVYLLEPHLKEGEGGLRDLHTAMWLAKVKYKIHSLRRAGAKGGHHPARDGRSGARARLPVAGAQLAAFPERAAFRSAHLRIPGGVWPRGWGSPPQDGQGASSVLMRTYYQQASVDQDVCRRAGGAHPRRARLRPLFPLRLRPPDPPRRAHPAQAAGSRRARAVQARPAQPADAFSPIARLMACNCRAPPTNWSGTICI